MIEIIPNWHPVFVHYALVLPTIAAVAFVVAHFAKNYSFKYHAAWMGRWALWAGAGFVVLAVAAGVYAYYTVNHDAPSHIAMGEHRNWALLTALLVWGLAGWAFFNMRHDKEESKWFVYAVLLASVLLVTTAWHGAELVYRYGLGVISLPVPEGEGHDHGGGGAHDHGAVVPPAAPATHLHDEADGLSLDSPAPDAHGHAEPHAH